jgi:hypothetical protein
LLLEAERGGFLRGACFALPPRALAVFDERALTDRMRHPPKSNARVWEN